MDSVYQSYIEYLPRKIIVERQGEIESICEIEENQKQALRPIHYGIFRKEIKNIWAERKLVIDEVIEDLVNLNLPEHSIFNNPNEGKYFWGRLGGNYCFIKQNLEEKQINYFQFGIDITKRETIGFVEKILEIASEREFILLGSNLTTFEPTKEKIDRYFRNSPAYKFIKAEEEFLENVEKGNEKTDVPFMTLKK